MCSTSTLVCPQNNERLDTERSFGPSTRLQIISGSEALLCPGGVVLGAPATDPSRWPVGSALRVLLGAPESASD